MKTRIIFLFAVMMLFFFPVFSAAENIYQQNYSVSNAGQTVSSSFAVQALKYEPYPVNPGSSFDIWVQVQNTGQNDARDVQFQLVNDYPFSSNDSLRAYSDVPGTLSGYQLRTSSDSATEANQVLMKFHVAVSGSAPEGTDMLKLEVGTNGLSNSSVYYLPISVQKTRTNFNVETSQITPQGSSFIITNTGNNDAGSVVVSIPAQKGISILQGYEPYSLGDLASGNFAVAHIDAVPQKNVDNITLEISYTDTAGIRNIVNETIPLNSLQLQNVCVSSVSGNYNWAYGIVGFLAGAFVIIMSVLLFRKKNKN